MMMNASLNVRARTLLVLSTFVALGCDADEPPAPAELRAGPDGCTPSPCATAELDLRGCHYALQGAEAVAQPMPLVDPGRDVTLTCLHEIVELRCDPSGNWRMTQETIALPPTSVPNGEVWELPDALNPEQLQETAPLGDRCEPRTASFLGFLEDGGLGPKQLPIAGETQTIEVPDWDGCGPPRLRAEFTTGYARHTHPGCPGEFGPTQCHVPEVQRHYSHPVAPGEPYVVRSVDAFVVAPHCSGTVQENGAAWQEILAEILADGDELTDGLLGELREMARQDAADSGRYWWVNFVSSETSTEAPPAMQLASFQPLPAERQSSDLVRDRHVDHVDVDTFCAAFRAGVDVPEYDVDGNGSVELADLSHLVEVGLETSLGDANLDGRFDSTDLLEVFAAGLYQTGALATWQTGDWNCDGRFDDVDMLAAFADGGYDP